MKQVFRTISTKARAYALPVLVTTGAALTGMCLYADSGYTDAGDNMRKCFSNSACSPAENDRSDRNLKLVFALCLPMMGLGVALVATTDSEPVVKKKYGQKKTPIVDNNGVKLNWR